MSEVAWTQGVHHVGLTVPNIEDTRAFFMDVLGFQKVGEKPEYPAVFVSDGAVMITLWQVSDPSTASAFDRKNCVGLHHLALRVSNQAVLLELHGILEQHPGVDVEFAPESLGGGEVQHMMCNIPGGVRVEFIALPE